MGYGDAPAPEEGFQRFVKPALMGGLAGGILSAIPLLNYLNFCLCALVALGSAVAVNTYLKDRPGQVLSGGEGAIIGGLAGVVAALMAWLVGVILFVALAADMGGLYKSMPGAGGTMSTGIVPLLIALPVVIIVMGGMGALYGLLSMHLFFKDRLRS